MDVDVEVDVDEDVDKDGDVDVDADEDGDADVNPKVLENRSGNKSAGKIMLQLQLVQWAGVTTQVKLN